MSLQEKGKLIKILNQETGSGQKGQWIKQPFVIETLGQYPKKICFEAWGDKTKEIERLMPGGEIIVHFNAESREHNEKWYTSLRVWKIEYKGEVYADSGTSQAGEDDDLPF